MNKKPKFCLPLHSCCFTFLMKKPSNSTSLIRKIFYDLCLCIKIRPKRGCWSAYRPQVRPMGRDIREPRHPSTIEHLEMQIFALHEIYMKCQCILQPLHADLLHFQCLFTWNYFCLTWRKKLSYDWLSACSNLPYTEQTKAQPYEFLGDAHISM